MRMKLFTWCTFLLLLAIASELSAQQNFASISFGVSIPQDPYRSVEKLSASGYARTGGAIKFDAAYFPVSYFGIGGSFSFGSNFANRDSMLSDISDHMEQNAPELGAIPEDAEIIYGSGFWNTISLLIGPHFSARASQSLYFDIRGLAGLAIVRPPDQELQILFDSNEIYSRSSKNWISFAFTAGGGLRYKLNSNIALKLGAEFYQTWARSEYTFDVLQGIIGEIPEIETEFPIRTVELTAGLAYSF